MTKHVYSAVEPGDMILRDYLAADRTLLANERTFLAYVRTSLTTIIVGLSVIKFFETFASQMIGVLLLFSGIIIMIVGIIRFKKETETIQRLRKMELKQVKATIVE